MEKYKISIVMPVRNAMPFLEACLHSIIHQSYSNWELIAINDHSTDDSQTLLEHYCAKDHRIRVVKNNGKGIIDALNFGYALMTGHFISRMDADDLMPENKLIELVRILETNGNGHLATGKVKYISQNELGDGFKKYEAWLNNLCDANSHYQEIYKECVIPSPCWMMYKDDFDKIGSFDSADYPEDYDLCFRMYENRIKVIPSPDILHIWRDHSQRASRMDDNYSDNRFLDLKVKYFLRNDYRSGESLLLWGAGKKGKRIAQLLLKKDIVFDWITNNPNKIGKYIYNKEITSEAAIKNTNNATIIIAVANEMEQKQIVTSILSSSENTSFYKFC